MMLVHALYLIPLLAISRVSRTFFVGFAIFALIYFPFHFFVYRKHYYDYFHRYNAVTGSSLNEYPVRGYDGAKKLYLLLKRQNNGELETLRVRARNSFLFSSITALLAFIALGGGVLYASR